MKKEMITEKINSDKADVMGCKKGAAVKWYYDLIYLIVVFISLIGLGLLFAWATAQ